MSRATRIPHASHPVVYGLLQGLIFVLVRIVYRYRLLGLENLPASGATIIAVNHLHLLDPIAVGGSIPRQVVTLAAEKWMDNWLVRQFLKGAGVIFVYRGEVDRKALRASIAVLQAGGALAVAPEGTRSRTGVLQRAKPGIAYLAMRTDPLIVPVACWGVERLRDWAKLRRPTCTVVFGEPFRLPVPAGKPSTQELQVLADQVMVRIAAMLPESYRGVYADMVAAEQGPHQEEISGAGQGT